MKKSSLSSKNNFFDLANFGVGKGVIIIILLVAIFSIYVVTIGSNPLIELKDHYKYGYPVSSYGYCFSNNYYAEHPIILFASSVLAIISFSFSTNKQHGITTLSFPMKRSNLFNKKVVLPICALSVAVIIIKAIMIGYNIKIHGINNELITQGLADIFICLKYVLLGFTAFTVSSIACGKKLEMAFGGISLIFVMDTVYNYLDSLLSSFLYGFDSIYFPENTEVNDFIFILNPTQELSAYYIFTEDLLLNKNKLIINILWVIALITVLVLTKQYFIKKFKPEKIEMKANNKPILLIITTTVSLLVTQILTSTIFDWYYRDVLTVSAGVYITISFVLIAVFSFITMSLIETTIKLNKNKLFGIIAPFSVVGLILIFAFSGGLGYENRIPKTEDIKSIDISTTFQCGEMFNTESSIEYTLSLQDNYMTFTTENDFNVIKSIHKTILENRDSDTGEALTITYTLKNGKTLSRDYQRLSEKSAGSLLSLWKTDATNELIKGYLFQNKATNGYEESDESEIYCYDYYGDYNYSEKSYSCFNYDTNDVLIVSKQNTETKVKDYLTREKLELVKEAIYKDYCELSSEEWFKPSKTYGAIVFKYEEDYYGDYFIDAMDEKYDWYGYSDDASLVILPVTAEMENTVRTLKSLGLYRYLNDNTIKIERMFTADVKEYLEWYNSKNAIIYNGYIKENSVCFMPDYSLESGIPAFLRENASNPLTDYSDEDLDYYGEYYSSPLEEYSNFTTAPVTVVENPSEKVKLLSQAHIKYYDEYQKGKILFVDYEGNLDCVYYIPA